MPKDKRVSSFSLDRSRSSPYPCSSKNSDQDSSKNLLQSVGDNKEWEEVRCPICMEHPHNAVLLICSSHEKGCHPFMCDTSCRHSNCLDQFRKSSATTKADRSEEALLGADHGESEDQRWHISRIAQGRQFQEKLSCPLCRGQIYGWNVIKAAREFMNAKPRSCSLETCNFSGTYSELRKHARLEHPSVRPSDADPIRQNDWARVERERDFEDFLSASHLESGEELGDWMNLVGDFEDIFDTFESESEGEWDGNLHMDIELELPFVFFETYFPAFPFFDPSVSDSPENSGQSRSRGTTPRTRALNQPRHPRPNNRRDSDLSWGSRSNRGQRQRRRWRRREHW
ncbi:hypothetical protein NMG60_11004932 [Bertholletia excelsa]